MSPQQAREIIEAAQGRIDEWKSKLRITTGSGVEAWDNATGQMVSVFPDEGEPVKEPLVLTPYLWANIQRVSILEPVYIPPTELVPGALLDPGRVLVESTGWYIHGEMRSLYSGEFFGEEAYKNPVTLVPNTEPPGRYPREEGYFTSTVFPDSDLPTVVPHQPYYPWIVPPQESVTAGVTYRPETVDNSTGEWIVENKTTTIMSIELSIRGYHPDYLDDRANRNLLPEFGKGQGVGFYDLRVRRTDLVEGPPFYAPPGVDENGAPYEGYMTTATTPQLTAERERVGFPPKTLIFTSLSSGRYASPGTIEVMGYRKV